VKRFQSMAVPVLLLLSTPWATPQNTHHFPSPPGSMDDQTQQSQSPSLPTKHIDLAQAQREADELARTAQTIPSDVASVRKGILPKDVIEKLKQIEKLSKRLRSELTP
jgi:hypothetical protein